VAEIDGNFLIQTARSADQWRGSYVTADSGGLIKVGGNLTVDNGTASAATGWNLANGSTFTFDGVANQTVALRNQKGDGLSFFDVHVANTGSPGSNKVILDDNMVIRGSFYIDSGVWSPNVMKYLVFKGLTGDNADLAQSISAYNGASTDLKYVYIKGGSVSAVKLLNDLTIATGDNVLSQGDLKMDLNCLLFLNDHTLTAEGQTITPTSGSQLWNGRSATQWGGGWIVGNPIPEPETLLLVGTGILGLLGYLRRRRMT
jgi:hypothetical protein